MAPMKFYTTILSILAVSLTSFSVYAIDAPQNVQLLESNDSSISLSWDEVSGAAGYIVHHGSTTGDYNFESPNLIEDTLYTISDLENNGTYYISVTSIDENVESSSFSDEIIATLWEEVQGFALDSIEVIDIDIIKLNFNAPLDTSDNAIQEIKITQRWNTLNELEVRDLTLDTNNNKGLYITFASTSLPEAGNEYDVTVIELQDSVGRNIESGRDAIETFIWLESPELQSAAPQEEVKPEAEDVAEVESTIWNAWVNIGESELAKSTTSVASENSELPDTGAEHIFLFILAFLLWTSVFIWNIKKV